MIVISSSLLPDLNKEQQDKRGEPIISFSYDNTLEETDSAMKTFQHRFASKKGKLALAAYALLSVAVIGGIFLNPSNVPLYFAFVFCAFGFFYSLTDKSRMRKKILTALKDMNPEEYRCTIYPEKIEVETIIKPKENEVSVKIDEDKDEEIITPLKTVFKFGDDLLNFDENGDSLLLIFNRRQIYCFPKRCLSKEQQDTVRDFLYKKLETES
ncbi:MAG: YcxB family protein [Ruminococcaceae bacterium]|nr:YcxB family protein [Oscillospiraceae bacterium]